MISGLLWTLLGSILTIVGITRVLRLTCNAIEGDDKQEWQREKMEPERLLQCRR
jgi:hypothetical protein